MANETNQPLQFGFQKLHVYRLAKGVAAEVVGNRGRFRGLPGELMSQLEKAMNSVVLNIAEGTGRWTAADQRRHYTIALGSATEVAACLDLALVYGVGEVAERALQSMGHIVPMLFALARRR
jgi:four helix bundle protein